MEFPIHKEFQTQSGDIIGVDFDGSVYGPAYDPIKAKIDEPLFRPVSGLTKSQKKKYRESERKRFADIEARQMREKIEKEAEENAAISNWKRMRSPKKNFSGVLTIEEARKQADRILDTYYPPLDESVFLGPGYDPIAAKIDEPLYRPIIGKTKSERKKFRESEVQRFADIETKQMELLAQMNDAGYGAGHSQPWKTYWGNLLYDFDDAASLIAKYDLE